MSIAADELVLYADNTAELYPLKMAIFKNLALKKAKKTYSRTKAAHFLGMRFGEAAAKRYAKEFADPVADPWNKMFTTLDRADAGLAWVDEFENMFREGHLDASLPKKYQRQAPINRALDKAATEPGNPHEKRICPVGMRVQTLLFPRAWPVSKAKQWARAHEFKVLKIHTSGQHHRLRQLPPSAFREGSFRTIVFGGSEVSAVVGCPK